MSSRFFDRVVLTRSTAVDLFVPESRLSQIAYSSDHVLVRNAIDIVRVKAIAAERPVMGDAARFLFINRRKSRRFLGLDQVQLAVHTPAFKASMMHLGLNTYDVIFQNMAELTFAQQVWPVF